MASERTWCVYLHTNNSNNKRYVGITSKPPRSRWSNGNGYSNNVYFSRAINKYGWDNFDHEVLIDGLTKEMAECHEVHLIKKYRSNDRDYGYNISSGGSCGCLHSEESKRKISESRKGENHYNYGGTLSDEHKRKISESEKGREITDEHKRKISESNKGKVFSVESRKKMSDGKKGMYDGDKHPNARKVFCDGVVFGCIKDCADHYGIHPSTMRDWLNPNKNVKMRKEFMELGLTYFFNKDVQDKK